MFGGDTVGVAMQAKRSAQTDIREYCCHFLSSNGDLEAQQLFSSPSDAAAALEAIEQLRERANSKCVELWKDRRLIVRYPTES